MGPMALDVRAMAKSMPSDGQVETMPSDAKPEKGPSPTEPEKGPSHTIVRKEITTHKYNMIYYII